MTDTTTAASGTDVVAPADPNVGNLTGEESSLSNWAGEYVTDMLGKGQALANQDYQAYTGPLSSGASTLQDQAFTGIGALQAPTVQGYNAQSFTDEGVAGQYMNPYLQQALQPQIDDATRQAQIQMLQNNSRLTKAGAYGGGRQAIMDSQSQAELLRNLANITGQGYRDAYNNAQGQFNAEQTFGLQANQQNNTLAKSIYDQQLLAGQTQRDIDQQAVDAARAQFEEERDFPYKQVQYQQSLLQGLPLAAQSYTYSQPSAVSEFLASMGGIMGFYDKYFGDDSGSSGGTSDPDYVDYANIGIE